MMVQTTRPHNDPIICSHPPVKTGRLTVWNQFRASQELFFFFLISVPLSLPLHVYRCIMGHYCHIEVCTNHDIVWAHYGVGTLVRTITVYTWVFQEDWNGFMIREISRCWIWAVTCHLLQLHPPLVCLCPSEWLCAEEDLMPSTFQTHNNLCVARPCFSDSMEELHAAHEWYWLGCREKYNVWVRVSSKPRWGFSKLSPPQTLQAA